ncbi:ribosomal protein S18 acetylase RimI-like enzyme [Pseudoduganella flava]|uniref:GNAT family N-acetyltransferase n=1 Tax=Pseudoduganella flava TaxID=871742 RepID=A0A562PFR4_9BURK|nr:GNAT family N-acetyltransferase [Pseudoduganella flava]QGZ38782.1 GNAT family N-acetyltransferase [Pseudoduganella flava]TWI42836.1 ribosomal protein S18 acetylase RimI-like enzyme [Pseudoduganella flava]
MTSPMLRAQRPEDEAFLRHLYAMTRDDLRQLPLDPASLGALIDMQYEAQRTGYRAMYPRASYLVVERDGEPLGRAIVDENDEELRLVDIALLPQTRGQGIGTALIGIWQRAAAGRGKRVVLSVLHTNGRARRLYEALGFVACGGDGVRCELVWRG